MRALLIPLVLLTGCATGIVPTDAGTYMIGKQGGMFVTQESTKAYVYAAANDFCSDKSMAVETVKVETRGPIPFVRAAEASLTFKCVPRQ